MKTKRVLIGALLVSMLLVLIGFAAYQYDQVWAYQLMEKEIEEALPGVDVTRIEIIEAGEYEDGKTFYYLAIDLFVYAEYEEEEGYYGLGSILMWVGFIQSEETTDPIMMAIVPLVKKYFPHMDKSIFTIAVNFCLPDRVGEGMKDLVIFQVMYIRNTTTDMFKVGQILAVPVFMQLSQMYPDKYPSE